MPRELNGEEPKERKTEYSKESDMLKEAFWDKLDDELESSSSLEEYEDGDVETESVSQRMETACNDAFGHVCLSLEQELKAENLHIQLTILKKALSALSKISSFDPALFEDLKLDVLGSASMFLVRAAEIFQESTFIDPIDIEVSILNAFSKVHNFDNQIGESLKKDLQSTGLTI